LFKATTTHQLDTTLKKYNLMKTFDKVQIAVHTDYCIVLVEFTIIKVINEHNRVYAMIAQDKIIVGQHMIDNTWRLSDPIDLSKIHVKDISHEDVTNEADLNAFEAANC
jgi:hypothetical protein